MIDSQKAIDTMRMSGPVIPSKIAKVLGTDIILASAVLSELLSSKKIKISKLKVGGSPVYYLPGQENKLENFKQYLNPKDQATLNLLKQKKILRDKSVEPLTRVSLREIKDFAIPLQVNVNGQKELFWKWHLVTNHEVQEGINSILNPPKFEEPKQEAPTQETKELKPEHEIKLSQPSVQESKEEIKSLQEISKPSIIQEPKIEVKKEEQIIQKQETQKTLKKPAVKKEPKENFFKKVKSHFSRKQIYIVKEVNEKRNDAEYIVKFESPVGSLEYYCRAKNKKRISDTDLDAAFTQGQLMKLPVLLVITGDLSKKAQEKLKEFKSIIIKKI